MDDELYEKSDMELKKHGGYRQGAGRKRLPSNQVKRLFTVRLPTYLIDWLRVQGTSQAVLIEDALVKEHRLK